VTQRSARTQRRLDDNREAFLEATRRLVTGGGFRMAHMAAIAAEAGFATGTLYRYFPSRAGLFAEVLARVSQQEVDVVAAIAGNGDPPPDQLAAAVTAFARRALRGHQLAHALIAEPVDPEIDNERLKYRRALSEELERIIERGVEQGCFDVADPRIAAAGVAGATMEALVGPLASPVSAADADHVVGSIVSFCLAAVGAGGQR
jgi:AcrR family transcriptional regulator